MEKLIMAGQMLLGLSILVGLHEFGHFAAAKYFKIRVDKFYIFFDFLFPMPGVMNFALIKKKIGETEYGLGWFPLGGYVAIHGMIDETTDADQLSAEPQPNEFRSKPAWQRLIVMLGGIIMNVITGIVIFSALTFLYGEEYLPATEVTYGVQPNALGQKIGFRTSDKIVKINGRPFTEFDDVYKPEVLIGKNGYYTVERQGQLVDIRVPVDFMDQLSDKSQTPFVLPLNPFEVGTVSPGSPAAKAGVQVGDQILKVGSQDTRFFPQLQDALKASANKETVLTVKRKDQLLNLTAKIDEDGKLGFMPKSLLHTATRTYGLGQAVPVGTKKAFGVITTQLTAFGKIFRGEASFRKSMGGPQAIAQQYGGEWEWEHFWTLTGMLSMVLAFMNLLPVPALDGGHVIFLLYEMVAGRKPSDSFLENAQKVGMVLILGLMVFVLFNDAIKSFF